MGLPGTNSLINLFGYVYITKNLINNKIYVGQHRSNKFDNTYFGSGNIIKNAINKYGIDNFTVHLLSWATDRQDLNNLEKFYICLYNSTNKNIGYNIQIGGQGSFISSHRNTLRGKDNPNYGSKRTPEQKKHLSKAHKKLRQQGKCGIKGRVGINNSYKNKFVNPKQLNSYLNMGWYKGTIPPKSVNMNSKHQKRLKHNRQYQAIRKLYNIPTKNKHQTNLGRTCINNGINNKFVFDFEIKDYLNKGWIKGALPKVKTEKVELKLQLIQKFGNNQYENIINKNRYSNNKVALTKNNICVFVDKDNVSFYKQLGFTLGGKTHNKQHNEKIKRANTGKITLTNGIKNLRCNKNEVDTYIKQGFWRGLTRKGGNKNGIINT